MRKTILGVLAAVGLIGCSGTDVGVSARVGAPRTAGQQARLAQQLVEAGPGIQVTRVRMVVRELDLEREDELSETEEEVEAGPFLIDLSGDELNGAISKVLDAEVAPGLYDEVEIEIHKLEDGEVGGNADLAAMGDASVIIDGTIDGEPFSFTSSLNEEQEHEARFEVGEGASNITLNIDPAGWFRDGSGSRLDPRVSGNRSLIEENIKRSIDAFDDDDRDGGEDEDENERED